MLWLDNETNEINNLQLENAKDFPFTLAQLIEKNSSLLTLSCGLVPEGSYVLSGTPEQITLKTPLNTEHTYAVSSDLKLVLVSQKALPLSLSELKANSSALRKSK